MPTIPRYSGQSADLAIALLNKALQEVYRWCLANRLTPHPGKSEVMLLCKKDMTLDSRGYFLAMKRATKEQPLESRVERHHRLLFLWLANLNKKQCLQTDIFPIAVGNNLTSCGLDCPPALEDLEREICTDFARATIAHFSKNLLESR